jgi:hypothetical protein
MARLVRSDREDTQRPPGVHPSHSDGGGSRDALLALQAAAGNRAVAGLVQRSSPHRPSTPRPVVQRVILYGGVQYSSYGLLAQNREAMAEVRKLYGNSFGYREKSRDWLADQDNVYNLAGELQKDVAVEKKEPEKAKPHPMQTLADHLRTLRPDYTKSASKHLGEKGVPRSLDDVDYEINNAQPYQLDLVTKGGEDHAHIFYLRTSPGVRNDRCRIIINLNEALVFHVGPGWGGSL